MVSEVCGDYNILESHIPHKATILFFFFFFFYWVGLGWRYLEYALICSGENTGWGRGAPPF